MPTRDIVTRFAPSPTGTLHVGGARTALYNWAYARQRGGTFLLRLEDTDRVRSTVASARGILADLAWLGISWDEGPAADGDPDGADLGNHGPYHQSRRLAVYDEQIERLLVAGHAYVPDDEPEIVRFRMGRDVVWQDAVYGQITVRGSELPDFVIRKGDGFPTFHLAVVVDDALMGVTHVIRGQEHLSNTPRHVALQAALDLPCPKYVHTPSILNSDGSKMSKRDRSKVARWAAREAIERGATTAEALIGAVGDAVLDTDAARLFLDGDSDDDAVAEAIAQCLGVALPEINVGDFRASGFLPEPLTNYLALLGWNPGDDIEQFDRQFLVDAFGFDRINRANARFDRNKLLAFNGDALRAMPPELFVHQLSDHFDRRHGTLRRQLGDRFEVFAGAYQSRSRTLDEPAHLGAFFGLPDRTLTYDPKAVRKVLAKNDHAGRASLEEAAVALEQASQWTAGALDELIAAVAEKGGCKMGEVAQPIRVAVSGGTVSPPLGQTLCILGRDATLARIEHCLAETRAAN